jgi:hypothetical protein
MIYIMYVLIKATRPIPLKAVIPAKAWIHFELYGRNMDSALSRE